MPCLSNKCTPVQSWFIWTNLLMLFDVIGYPLSSSVPCHVFSMTMYMSFLPLGFPSGFAPKENHWVLVSKTPNLSFKTNNIPFLGSVHIQNISTLLRHTIIIENTNDNKRPDVRALLFIHAVNHQEACSWKVRKCESNSSFKSKTTCKSSTILLLIWEDKGMFQDYYVYKAYWMYFK